MQTNKFDILIQFRYCVLKLNLVFILLKIRQFNYQEIYSKG